MAVYLITGANRGLGLEFTRQLVSQGHTVFALCRNPHEAPALRALEAAAGDRLQIRIGDVATDASLRSVASELESLDVLINNAGVMGERGIGLSELSLDAMAKVMDTNVYGVLRATRAFLPALRKGKLKKVANISSLMGSISDNSSGGSYAYRVSKAAVNMLTRTMAHELAAEKFTVLALHPGWVKTDMGGSQAPLESPDSIAAMLSTIHAKGPSDSGGFFARDGAELPF